MLENNLFDYYEKNKKYIIIGTIVFVIISISIQLILFFNENIGEEDILFKSLSWSEYCDGEVYSEEDKQTFCDDCYNEGGVACEWPLDMNISVPVAKKTFSTGGEVHCYSIIDGINYYHEKGKYFGLSENDLFTWELLDATKEHEVSFCCGIERETSITKILGIEKHWPQACVKKSVSARCSNNK